MGQILVLTSDAPLPAGLAGDAAEAAGAEPAALVSLGPRGAEIPLAASDPAAALSAARAAIGDARVDVNLVPATGRRKSVLVADMDSTIIGCECIDELADIAGLKAEIAAITERAMAGELDFEEALTARVSRLAGVPEAALARTMAERVRLTPGARVLVRTMAALGARTALVSGGFTYFTERVAEAAGFHEHRANHLILADGRLTGDVARPILGREAKLAELQRLSGLRPDRAIAIGDGANDLAMMDAAGLGVGYRPKAKLAAGADAVLWHSDLSAVLHLQGIPAEAFVHG